MNRNSQKPVPDFSVVIPALNLRTSLELILRCLEAQTYPVDRFECIIVDDGSTDGTRKFLESYPPTSFQLTFISHAVPQGRGAARNQGWRRAQGKVIVFLDGDTLPSPQWLSDYDRAFASGFYDVVSGGRYCNQVIPSGKISFSIWLTWHKQQSTTCFALPRNFSSIVWITMLRFQSIEFLLFRNLSWKYVKYVCRSQKAFCAPTHLWAPT